LGSFKLLEQWSAGGLEKRPFNVSRHSPALAATCMALPCGGFPLRLIPVFRGRLVQVLSKKRELVRRRYAEAIQGKDGRSHRDAPCAVDHGFVTAGAQRRGRRGLKIPRIPNPPRHFVQLIAQCDDLRPGHLRPPVSPKNLDHFWKPGTLSVTGCHSTNPAAGLNVGNHRRCAAFSRGVRWNGGLCRRPRGRGTTSIKGHARFEDCNFNRGGPLQLQRCRSSSSASSHRTRAWRQRDRDRLSLSSEAAA